MSLDASEHGTRDARVHPVYYNGPNNKTKMNPLGRSRRTCATNGTLIETSSCDHNKTQFKITEIRVNEIRLGGPDHSCNPTATLRPVMYFGMHRKAHMHCNRIFGDHVFAKKVIFITNYQRDSEYAINLLLQFVLRGPGGHPQNSAHTKLRSQVSAADHKKYSLRLGRVSMSEHGQVLPAYKTKKMAATSCCVFFPSHEEAD